MLAVVLFVDDRGSTYDAIPSHSESSPNENGFATNEECKFTSCDKHLSLEPLLMDATMDDDDGCDRRTKTAQVWLCTPPDPSALLYAVQAAGWAGVTAQSFFWTSWRHAEVGCIDLALQGVIGMVTAGLLPLANRYFGAATVWCGSELFFHLSMMSVCLVSSSSGTARLISAVSGVNYAVHATNALIVAADIIPDPAKRARTIAMVNNALPMGQLITALSGGAIAQYFGGFEYAFVCYGALGASVTTIVWVYTSKHGLFSKQTSRAINHN